MNTEQKLREALRELSLYVAVNGDTWVQEKALAALAAEPEQVEIGADWTPCMKLPVVVHVRQQREGEQHVSTREGITPVKPDDLIMRGVSGEEYPIGKDIFEKTYTLDTTQQPAPPVRLTDEEVMDLTSEMFVAPRWPSTILEAAEVLQNEWIKKNGG